MEHFAYSFAITMLHSIWQMALLLLVYEGMVFHFKNLPPLAKRNLLYFILGTQVVTTVVGFYMMYSRPFRDFQINLQALLSNFSTTQSWLKVYAETIFWLYALMVIFKLANSLVNWVSFRQHYPTTLTKPSIHIRLFTQIKAHHFGITQKVSIWCSNTIYTPMTFGFWKPVILLPIALINQLNIEQTEALIIHELTHIKNNDYLLNWMLVITGAVYFFNPFILIITEKIKLEREKNCDAKVLHFDYPAIGYAETLLHTARQQQMAYTLQMQAVKNTKQLLKRIEFFTVNGSYNHKQNNRFLYAVFVLMVFVLMNMIIAGYFLRNNSNSPSVEYNSPLVAMPANEWNKFFYNDPVINTKSPTITSLTLANKGNSSQFRSISKTKQQHKKNNEDFYNGEENNFMHTPVLFNEPSPPFSNDIIIKEETSSGKTITKYYQLRNVNGEWIMLPLWMTAEIKPLKDSNLHFIKDSSFPRIIPAVQ